MQYYNGILCTKSPKQYDIRLMLEQWRDIESKLTPDHWVCYNGLHHETAVQYSEHCTNKYIDSCIGVDSTGFERVHFRDVKKVHNNNIKDETAINTIVPEYQGTVFEEILKDFNGCRGRVMGLSSGRCYNAHKDGTSPYGRYGLALETNYCCGFWYPNYGKIYYIPADGHVYWVNINSTHSVINASDNLKLRYHFTFTSTNPVEQWPEASTEPPKEIQMLDDDKHTSNEIYTQG